MSYCRFDRDCDVYAYKDTRGRYHVMVVDRPGYRLLATPGEAADLLEDIQERGCAVPQSAIDELRAEERSS